MSASEAVQELQERLSATQADLASARADADARARDLQHDPTAERQRLRNDAESAAELYSLQIARIEKDLAAAREIERQARIVALHEAHARDVHGVATAAGAELLAGVVAVETALKRLEALRRRARATTAHLRAAGDVDSSTQIGLRPDRDLARRLEALAPRYDRALHPVLG